MMYVFVSQEHARRCSLCDGFWLGLMMARAAGVAMMMMCGNGSKWFSCRHAKIAHTRRRRRQRRAMSVVCCGFYVVRLSERSF